MAERVIELYGVSRCVRIEDVDTLFLKSRSLKRNAVKFQDDFSRELGKRLRGVLRRFAFTLRHGIEPTINYYVDAFIPIRLVGETGSGAVVEFGLSLKNRFGGHRKNFFVPVFVGDGFLSTATPFVLAVRNGVLMDFDWKRSFRETIKQFAGWPVGGYYAFASEKTFSYAIVHDGFAVRNGKLQYYADVRERRPGYGIEKYSVVLAVGESAEFVGVRPAIDPSVLLIRSGDDFCVPRKVSIPALTGVSLGGSRVSFVVPTVGGLEALLTNIDGWELTDHSMNRKVLEVSRGEFKAFWGLVRGEDALGVPLEVVFERDGLSSLSMKDFLDKASAIRLAVFVPGENKLSSILIKKV